MSFSPQLFLSNMKAKGGPAKPSRFEVVIPIPSYINSFVQQSILEKILNIPNSIFTTVEGAVNKVIGNNKENDQAGLSSNPSISRYLALQCESAELPGKTLQTADVKIYGPTFKVPYQTAYNDLALTFICTNEFYERKLFDRWMEAIMPPDTNNLRYPKDNSSRYMTNIKVIQYDELIKRIYSVEMIDAFPIGIASQPLSWAEEGFHKLSVQFAYQRYRVIYNGGYDLAQAAGAIFGTAGSRLFDKVSGGIGNTVGRLFF